VFERIRDAYRKMDRDDREITFLGAITIAIIVASIFCGCGTLSLRPVQPDHALRKAEVTQKLGVDAPTLDTALAADSAHCNALDNTVTGLTATSIGLGVLSGGSGLTALLTDAVPQKATGGVTLGLAVLTSTFAYLTTSFSQKYTRQCAVNVGGK